MIHNHQTSVAVVGAPAYPPPQPGYPPPQQPGYPPQQPGYPAPAGYPPGYMQPGYQQSYPQMQPQPQATSVVVVGAQPTNTVVVNQRRGTNHMLHLIITIFFWPWVIVWIIVCIMEDGKGAF